MDESSEFSENSMLKKTDSLISSLKENTPSILKGAEIAFSSKPFEIIKQTNEEDLLSGDSPGNRSQKDHAF
jgi:hypothetical protein